MAVQVTPQQGYGWQLWPAYAATVAHNAQVSSTIDCQGFTLCGILFPAAFTSTTLTFNVSVDGTSWVALNTASATPLSYTCAQGTWLAIDPAPFQGVRYLQLATGSAEGGLRTLYLALRGKA